MSTGYRIYFKFADNGSYVPFAPPPRPELYPTFEAARAATYLSDPAEAYADEDEWQSVNEGTWFLNQKILDLMARNSPWLIEAVKVPENDQEKHGHRTVTMQVTDTDVDHFARYITGHPDAPPNATQLAATRAVLSGVAREGRLFPPDTLALIKDLVDSDDCWFDHHGGCQAHGYLLLEPDQKCPQQQAKELIEAAESEHGHQVCGTLWDSTSLRDVEEAARWADSLRDTHGPADARRAAENLRSPYLCNWDPEVAQALAAWLEESADEAEAGRPNARAALTARRLLESWGMVDREPRANPNIPNS